MTNKRINGEPLNILHTIDLEQLYPIIRCQLKLSQPLDQPRLAAALQTIGQVIPEIFAGYDLTTNQWILDVLEPKRILHQVDADQNIDELKLDLQAGPQLHVYLQPAAPGQRVTFVISHILTDGAGFKQFLYLLAKIYNEGAAVIDSVENHTDIEGIKALLQQRPPQTLRPTDHPLTPLALPRLAEIDRPRTHYVGATHLSSLESSRLLHWAHQQKVTINDVLLAVFGQLMQSYAAVPQITLACPTDMRQFLPVALRQQLRIQNSTARYNLTLTNEPTRPLTQTIQAVHRQMTALKQQQQFLQSIEHLIDLAETAEISDLQALTHQNYSVRPVGYTNLGIIDATRLRFVDTTVTSCLLTGSFRIAPAFQAAFSSFSGQLIIGFNMIGTPAEIKFGQTILSQLQQNLQLVSRASEL